MPSFWNWLDRNPAQPKAFGRLDDDNLAIGS
jgi:hypothetical protein